MVWINGIRCEYSVASFRKYINTPNLPGGREAILDEERLGECYIVPTMD